MREEEKEISKELTMDLEAKKKKTFDFWESDLRYRIKQEEEKYNNDVSRESGIDWVEMIIQKSLNDIVLEADNLIDQAISQQRAADQEKLKAAIGLLRQWLNESRITDKKMVTNEELEVWLIGKGGLDGQ